MSLVVVGGPADRGIVNRGDGATGTGNKGVQVIDEVESGMVDARSTGKEITAVQFKLNGITDIEVVAVEDVEVRLEIAEERR